MKLTRFGAVIGAIALILAFAMSTFAASVEPVEHSGNITSCPEPYTGITITPPSTSGSGGGIGVNVTYSQAQNINDTLAFTVTGGVVNIAYVKAGDGYYEYNYGGAGTTADTGLRAPDNVGGQQPTISHSVFCVSEVDPTPTPTEAATPTPTPTEAATPTPTQTEAATPTPEGSIGGETGTPPTTTLPPTDAFGGLVAPGSGAWAILLAVMAGIVASVLVLTPRRRNRNRIR